MVLKIQSDNSPFLGTKNPSITTAERGCLFTDLKQHCQQLDTSKALLMCWLGARPLRQGAHTTWHHLPPDSSTKPACLLGVARDLSQSCDC